MFLQKLVERRDRAQERAHEILGAHEESASRIVELSTAFKRLSNLPVDVADYYREALRALKVGCFRAAVVITWPGFVYMVAQKLATGYQPELQKNYSKWKTANASELLESAPEAQILEAARKVGLISNQQLNIYKGWLSTRNQCAHATLFQPSRNVTLGYVDAILNEVPEFL